ncbi:MAG: pyrimidine dimer DNA glycosylase/endonuclease V [Chitinophagaceae bacterium]|nr:hypothetical protein [Chitinophagaceae bacterium]MCB0739867.1 hypothetical protein [Chitinophagaceae bacterium]
MRIWSLHPKYLDAKGLVALWRETLLAQHVLAGQTKGYRNHPQLERFKKQKKPLHCIHLYLEAVFKESKSRSYNFDASKFEKDLPKIKMTVTTGQLAYETQHLLKKLLQRDPVKYKEIKKLKRLDTHPLFRIIEGPIASWEIQS